MPIYYGNTKINNLYYGSNRIKEVYQGSTMVYSAGISIWKFDKDSVSEFLIGSYDTSGYLINSETHVLGTATITSISGAIGDAGSSVTANWTTGTTTGTNTFNIGTTPKVITLGIYTVYMYTAHGTHAIYIITGSTVGCVALYTKLKTLRQPTTVNSTQIVFEGVTYTRDTSYLKSWNKDGII